MSDLPSDGMRDDDVLATIVVRVHRSGAMSVAGDIHEEQFALSMIDAARDSVRSHHLRKKGEIIIPAHETGLQ
jgi:hypothetical protein